jgi:hypothetical protein
MRCGGAFAHGTIPDYTHGRIRRSTWEGDPIGPLKKLLGVVEMPRPRRTGRIEAFRCEGCGMLELVVPRVE